METKSNILYHLPGTHICHYQNPNGLIKIDYTVPIMDKASQKYLTTNSYEELYSSINYRVKFSPDLSAHPGPSAVAGLVCRHEEGPGRLPPAGEARKLPSSVLKTGKSSRREPLAMTDKRSGAVEKRSEVLPPASARSAVRGAPGTQRRSSKERGVGLWAEPIGVDKKVL